MNTIHSVSLHFKAQNLQIALFPVSVPVLHHPAFGLWPSRYASILLPYATRRADP